MPQFDFGHFYKFIVSAGVVLVGLAFIAPWIVFQSTGILTIPMNDLAELTATARSLIIERQNGLSDFQNWAFPGLPLALSITGLGLIILGLIFWHERQAKQNAIEDLDHDRKLAEFSDATPSEVDSKLRDEATEDLPTEATVATKSIPEESDSRAPAIPIAPLRRTVNITSLMGRIHDWEVSLFDRLDQAYLGPVRARRHVRMTTVDGRTYIIDALLGPTVDSEWGELAIELKSVSSRNNLLHRIRDASIRIGAVAVNLKSGLVYTGQPGRPPRTRTTAIVMIVCDNFELADDALRSSAEAVVREMNSIMNISIGIIAISAESFETIDAAAMRSLIADAWTNRAEASQLVWRP